MMAGIDVFKPLSLLVSDERALVDFFYIIGWDINSLFNNDITTLRSTIVSINLSVKQAYQIINDQQDISFASIKKMLTALKSISVAFERLTTLPITTPIAEALATDLLRKLLVYYLGTKHPALYSILSILGIITSDTTTIYNGQKYVKFIGQTPILSFEKFLNAIKNPTTVFKNEYWPANDNDFATINETNKVANKLFSRVADFLTSVGIFAYMGRNQASTPFSATDAIVFDGLLYAVKNIKISSGLDLELGIGAGLLPVDQGGPGLYFFPFGLGNYKAKTHNWLIVLQASLAEGAIVIKENTVDIISSSSSNKVEFSLEILSGSEVLYKLGSDDGTHIEIGKASIGFQFSATTSSRSYGVYINFGDSNFRLSSGEGNSFFKKIIPATGIAVNFNALLGWSNDKGFYFGGKAGFQNSIPINGGNDSKFLRLTSFDTSLLVTDQLSISVGASGELTLGPVKIIVEKTGLKTSLASATNGGNFGPFNVEIDFDHPKGVGIEVNSDNISGGGHLSFNPAAHTYTGIAHLKFNKKLNLNAIGILQTELPNNQPGYSLLLLITATGFKPIQLGLGFTLNGIGGLVGINRTINVPYLRSQVQTGNLDKLMFPDNVLDNPVQVLSTVDSSFPAAEGRYVFGLMAKIGWGTPTLLTLDLALIIELPTQVRIVLLGVLKAILPDEDHQLIKIRADFLGVVDFAAKKVSFNASLSDSRILQFALTGDAAFRLYLGDNPVFILTVGGFHPAFQPPANADLSIISRLTLALANNNDIRIILTSYLAVTSNTVQFGSRLDLFVDLPAGFSLVGFLAFDVLFQFHPFHIEAYLGAGVAIRRKGETKFSLYLSLNVSGPAPWHVTGQVSFNFLVWEIKHRIDKTFGSGAAAQPLEDINVHTLFLNALNDKGNWEVEQSTESTRNATVLSAITQDPSHLLIDPSGALVFRQKLVPLQYALEKFSNANVTGGNQFDIINIKPVLTNNEAATLPNVSLNPVMDFFAPEQFRRMTDAQKLSSPSFQLMRSGYRLKGLDGFSGGRPVSKIVDYEQLVIPAITNSGSQELADRTVMRSAPVYSSRFTPDEKLFQRLARNSSINRAYQKEVTSALVPKPVSWAEDTYVVVDARDLTPYGVTTVSFQNEAEATAYLKVKVASGTIQAGALLVMPSYQLYIA